MSPESKHRGAVGDDSAEIAAPRQFVAFFNVFLNLEARLRHAGV